LRRTRHARHTTACRHRRAAHREAPPMIASSRDRDDAGGETGAPSAARSDRASRSSSPPSATPAWTTGRHRQLAYRGSTSHLMGDRMASSGHPHVARNSDGKPWPRC
jgi:hypothetical protein